MCIERVWKCQPAQGLLLSQILPTFGAGEPRIQSWQGSSWFTSAGTGTRSTQYRAQLSISLQHISVVVLQGLSPKLPLFLWSLLESQQGTQHCTKKGACTHQSQLVQKLSEDNDRVTFVLMGEIRNRHSSCKYTPIWQMDKSCSLQMELLSPLNVKKR